MDYISHCKFRQVFNSRKGNFHQPVDISVEMTNSPYGLFSAII